MGVYKGGQNNPFCDLGTVDARRGCQGNRGGGIYWGLGDVVGTRGKQLYQL